MYSIDKHDNTRNQKRVPTFQLRELGRQLFTLQFQLCIVWMSPNWSTFFGLATIFLKKIINSTNCQEEICEIAHIFKKYTLGCFYTHYRELFQFYSCWFHILGVSSFHIPATVAFSHEDVIKIMQQRDNIDHADHLLRFQFVRRMASFTLSMASNGHNLPSLA